jgi:hypothetical protein
MRDVQKPVWLWVGGLATLVLGALAVVRLWPAG